MGYIQNFFDLAIALSLTSCMTPATNSFQSNENAIVDKLATEALLYAKREESPVSGLSLAIYKAGQPIHTKGYGTADISKNIAVKPDTVFRIGSITKQFTAAGIMSLVEEGKLVLDESASAYLSNVKKATQRNYCKASAQPHFRNS
ncbi:MAG: class A beta-lactamase-related serine hydrolase [Proteobacteria bacterium]|nr:MAG: class A beta-lactamase-related serine hydrolase [Pseudomonadota bacterium]